ncbi:MAG: hypothetical protein EXS13_04330 [Planctomycetes bacterium]|nr:hypothetical protein [Planctomycetota bacterium]
MASSERSIHLSGLAPRERQRLWVGVSMRSAIVCIVAGSVLLTVLAGVREIESRLAIPPGAWSEVAARRLGDAVTIVSGGVLFGSAVWSLFQWLLRVPIGRLRFAVVRVEEAK